VGRPSGDAWAHAVAGGGARVTAQAVSGGCRSEAEGEAGRQRKKKQAGVRRTCLQFEKIPGTPL
jgi:hypothetical protein